MKISRNSFVKKYKALKKCSTQKALLKWNKILLHFGIDVSLKTLKFGMDNDAATNQAVQIQAAPPQQSLYRAILLDNDVFVINNLRVIVGEVKRLADGTFQATNFITKVNILYNDCEEALNSLGFGNNLQSEQLTYTYTDINNNITQKITNTRIVDASLILNHAFFNKCTQYSRNGRCDSNKEAFKVLGSKLEQDCLQFLRNYLNATKVEARECANGDEYYENFHTPPIRNDNSNRKYHLTFHKPPSQNDTGVGAFHFKIDNSASKKLVFDVVDRKFYFQEVLNQRFVFPNNQQVNGVLNCIQETLNNFLNLDRIKVGNAYHYPTLPNELNFKGKIGDYPTSIPYYETKLEIRVNDRIDKDTNKIHNQRKLDFRDFQNQNFKSTLLDLTSKRYMKKQDVEEMFFIKGMSNAKFSKTFIKEVYLNNIF